MAPVKSITINGLKIFSDGDKVLIDNHQVYPMIYHNPTAPAPAPAPAISNPISTPDDPLPTALFKTFVRLIREHPYILLLFLVVIAGNIITFQESASPRCIG